MQRRKGFTLVELLVVIAIIGLLSTIAFISLNSARAKARDAKRVSDIRQLQSALELYYNNQTSPQYPKTPSGSVIINSTILNSTYVAAIPVAPLPAESGCTGAGDNDYYYTAEISSGATCDDLPSAEVCTNYRITGCIGSASGGLPAGCIIARPTGFAGIACAQTP